MNKKDSQFFPMPASHLLSLAALVVFSLFAFLPVWRVVSWRGMVGFGWLMAVLMVASPTLALYVFYRERRKNRSRGSR